MKVLQSIRNNIPNAITCLNMLSGAIACIFALQGAEYTGVLKGYEIAFIFIGFAAVFDFCDGLVARMLDTVSPIGKELDSLSDCVSFGLAPSMLIYAMMEHFHPGEICNFAAFFIAIFGALRLAKFNVDTTQTTVFKGMPIPANAIFWMGYVNFCYTSGSAGFMVWVFVAALSLLMVCNMPMFSFKMKTFGIKDNIHRYLLIAITITLVATLKISGLYHAIIAYAILSFFFMKKA